MSRGILVAPEQGIYEQQTAFHSSNQRICCGNKLNALCKGQSATVTLRNLKDWFGDNSGRFGGVSIKKTKIKRNKHDFSSITLTSRSIYLLQKTKR